MNDLPVARPHIFAWETQTVLKSPEGQTLILINIRETNTLSNEIYFLEIAFYTPVIPGQTIEQIYIRGDGVVLIERYFSR